MKNLIYIATILLLMTSCNEWLDIQPEASVSKDELFSTKEGFYEALNGIYTRCSQGELYGGEFSVGVPEVLAQSYTNTVYDYTGYLKTSLFDFTAPTFKSRRDNIWKAAYNAITNCNLILENIDNKKGLFTVDECGMIKGEALALRAYIHFDVLRLFSPSYLVGASQNAIPYVTTYSNKVTPLSTVAEVITKALADLTEAKGLLARDIIVIDSDYKVGYPSDDVVTEEDNPELFLQNRRHRLNYYAVCGELARVYLYSGDHANAISNALVVINSGKFPWTKGSALLEADLQKKDRIMYNELVFGWYAQSQKKQLYNRFSSTVTGQFIDYDNARNFYEVGGVGAEDFRFKAWFSQVSGTSGIQYKIMKYMRDDDINLHYLMIPGIRLSEMYYIAAESAYATNPAKAWEYLNTVRFHRGIGTSLGESSGTPFMTEILKEYRKETYAEGQLYFSFKRLNENIIGQSNAIFPAGSDIYVIPLPEDEVEFANR